MDTSSHKITLLHVIIGNGFGGLEKVVYHIIKNVDQRKYNCILLCFQEPDILREMFARTGVTIISLGLSRGIHYSIPGRINAVVKEYGVDIIHCHDFQPFLYCALSQLFSKRCKLVFTEHSGAFSLSRRHRWLLRLLYPVVDRKVMVSEELRAFYIEKLRVKEKGLVTIYNGVDRPEFANNVICDKVKEELQLQGKFIVGTAVRLMPQKGLGYLVDAFKSLVEKEENIFLLIIGDGRSRNELEERVQALGLQNNVCFLGYRDDAVQLLPLFDIYILPSLWEGLPLGLLEAMFSRKAVIATEVGGIPEVVTSGENGILIPPADSEAIVQAVLRLYNNDEEREKIGANALQSVEKSYSTATMVNRYQELYQELMRC